MVYQRCKHLSVLIRLQLGACTYGDQCKFSHAPDQQASAHPSILPDNKQLAIEGAEGPIIWHVHSTDSDLDEDYRRALVSFDDELGMEVIEW